MDDKKAPNQEQKFYYPVIYLGGMPAEILKKKKKWWKRTETIACSDFFQIEQNKMVVYHIIPHSNVSNNTRRLWKSIYEMYEMYESPGTRLERDGLCLVYREKDFFSSM
ncbi:TPA: hypothetical protein ACTZ5W_006034 [Bacillus cereus]